MPDDIASDVTEPIAAPVDRMGEAFTQALNRLEDAIKIQGEQISGLTGHATNMMAEIMKLHALRAVQEVPAAVADVVHAEGDAASNLLEGAADVGAAPAEVFVSRRHGLRRIREKA